MSAWLARHGTLLRWLPALSWMVVIFLLSSQSGLQVSQDPAVDKPFRLSAHVASYALLAGLLLYAVSGARRPTLRAAVVALALTAVYAISDELHQSLVPDRTGRAADVLVDVLGAAFGLLIAALILGSRDRLRGGAGPGEP
jgi:VanZ family protein